MINRRLEEVHTKLWMTFGLSLLEYESKNHHDGHLSVLDSDSFVCLQSLCISTVSCHWASHPRPWEAMRISSSVIDAVEDQQLLQLTKLKETAGTLVPHGKIESCNLFYFRVNSGKLNRLRFQQY